MAIEQTWNDVPLTLSFRSTEAVLKAVDAVFNKRPAAEGVIWNDGDIIEHHAFRTGQAGLVELWPVVAETKIEPAEAFEPWNEDAVPPHAVDVLCQRIAGQIKAWLDKDEELESEGRKIKAGDILILVRRREPFTAPMIRALKREKIAVAGADRMQLLQQIAVMDLMALADVLLMPEDDLSLAVVLKSPLFGLNDDDLFELAFERRTSLWNVLAGQGQGECAVHGGRRNSVALALARRSHAALRILPRAARRERAGDAEAHAHADLDLKPPSLSMSSSTLRSASTGKPRRRCKASSTPCARPTSRSSATWSRSATRSAS